MRAWMLSVGLMLLAGTLLGCGHDPNHDVNREQARAAANRVHTPPQLSPSDRAKVAQDHGG